MFFKFKKKSGFTLVELLLVIFIIAILSTLAVSGYTQYRRATLLDFTVDSFIAQFYGVKDKTIRGDYIGSRFDEIKTASSDDEGVLDVAPEDGNLKCYGFGFSLDADGEGYLVEPIAYEYSNKKEFDVVTKSFNYVGCSEVSGESFILELDSAFKFLEISDENGNSIDDFEIIFAPPKGEMTVLTGGGVFQESLINLQVKYGESDDLKYQKTMQVDVKSGKIYVISNDVGNE